MLLNRRIFVTFAAALGISVPAALLAQAPAAPSAADKEKAGLAAGVEAVVYGYPLVIMDVTKAKTTNFVSPVAFGGPPNQFANVRAFPDASFKDVVRANVDTLYSSAFLDLGPEPTRIEKGQNAARCELREANTQIVNAETGAAFTWRDPCVKLGATIAYNDAAYQAAKADVSAFLVKVFGLH